MSEKIGEQHLARRAILYMRQSSLQQLVHNEESRRQQYAMRDRLRDAATSLRTRPEYAVQLANVATWNATEGDNTLVAAVTVSSSAPGSVDPSARQFTVIP